jgi:hypothetical protein
MNKLAVAFLALAFVTVPVISQASTTQRAKTKCNLTDNSAPSVRGLRLGMSTQELLALFPGVTNRREMKDAIEKAKSGAGGEVVYLGFEAATEGDAQQFAGVVSVAAGVAKARVVDFSIQYAGATWSTIDEWVTKLSETLKLPGKGNWTAGMSESPNKVLRCGGIEIEAAIQGDGASIRITNTAFFKPTDDRAAEQKKRREFKP